MTDLNVYQQHGYKNREDYIEAMADEFGYPIETVLAMVEILEDRRVRRMNEAGAQRLRTLIDESGYKQKFIAKKVGLTLQGFINKVNDISRFRVPELARLCELLRIENEEREELFFAPYVDSKSTKGSSKKR